MIDTTLKKEMSYYKLINSIIMFLYGIQLFLNFTTSPLVKYNYLLIVIVNIISIIFLPKKYAIINLAFFILFEGQGRIVWGYHPLFRIIFDLTCLIFVIRTFITEKKIINSDVLPQFLRILILGHFLWWGLVLFNPNGAGVLPSFITSKYYIFPFLLFFSFLQTPFDFSDKSIQKGMWGFMLLSIVMAILCHIQNIEGLPFLTEVSNNYANLFKKFGSFLGKRFRPWGTSYSPGGMATFVYMTIGFFFLFDEKVAFSNRIKIIYGKIGKYLFVAFSFYSAFISQVRSAFIKTILIFAISSFIVFMCSKFKLRTLIATFVLICLALFSGVNVDTFIEDESLAASVKRYEELSEEGIGGQRSGVSEVIDALSDRLELPFGFGLGMTTGYSSAFADKRSERIDLPKYYFWSLDNLYVFLLLELGVGGVLYILVILSIGVLLGFMTVTVYKQQDDVNIKPIATSFATFIVLIIGNWGAVGMPFNPESFFTWLWVSIGFRAYYKHLKTFKIKGKSETKIESN